MLTMHHGMNVILTINKVRTTQQGAWTADQA